MLKTLPRPLGWRVNGARIPPLEMLLAWHADAEDSYGRYCREDRRRPYKIASDATRLAAG